MGVKGCVRGLALNKVGAPVTASKALADDLRGETEVGIAFAAAKMGSMIGEKLSFWSSDRDGVDIW
jgi:hypothetical protein